jgi:iron complex outermembrane receptor protein
MLRRSVPRKWSPVRRAFLGALAAALATNVGAQQADSARRDSTRLRLTPIVISGARQSATVGGASAIVVPIDSLRTTPAAPLEEVLRQMPFVQVRQNSRGEIELSVRGSDSRQAAVLFDGIPITLGWDSRADPSVFPLSGVGSMVLVRGLATLLQGPNTLGGVLELGAVSNRADAATETRVGLNVGVDQVGAQGYQIDAVTPRKLGRGELTVRIGAGYRDRPAIALSEKVRDRFSRDDRRANSDFSQTDGYLAVRYSKPSGAWLGMSFSGYGAERGVMPELHISAPRFWRYPEQTRQLFLLSSGTGRKRTPLGAGDMEFVVGLNASKTLIESYLDARYDSVTATERGDERVRTTRLLADHTLGRGEIRSAFTLASISYDETLGRAPASLYEQRLWSGAVEVDQPIVGSLAVTTGVGYDVAETPKSGGKPSLGRLNEWGGRAGLTTLAFSSRWRLHASASRRARFAALRELYSGALNRFEPNPSLRPEILVGGEFGATLISSRWQFQGVVFRQRLEDAVVRITLPDRRFQRVNRDHINSRGLELLAGAAIGQATLSADAMIQKVRIADPAVAGTARRMENQPAFRLGSDASVPIPAGVRARLSLDHAGAQYCVNPDLQANERLKPQTSVGGGLERLWQFGAGLLRTLRTSVQVDNLGDAAVFDQCGLPFAGRTVRIGVSLR